MYGFVTTYGNGYKKIYIPNENENGIKRPYIPLTAEERLEENKRLRGVKTRQNFVQRACSTNSYEYFSTLTTDNEELANDPVRLLLLGKEFLLDSIKRYDYINNKFIIVLERFKNRRKGFHLHSLSDFPLNLDDWEINFGANKENDREIIKNEYDENYIENYYKKNNKNRNLYCERLVFLEKAERDGVEINNIIRSFAVSFPINYMAKKLKETKALVEEIYSDKERISLYASNVEKIDRNTEYVDIEEYFNDFDNEKNEDFKNFISVFEEFEDSKNENVIKNIDFYDFEKNYYNISFQIIKKENPINYDGFLNEKFLKIYNYVNYRDYKIEKLNEEIIFNNFRIEEIKNVIDEFLKIDKNFDISCYLEAINGFNKDIGMLERRITILTNTNSPNSDVFCHSYNCNSSIEKESPNTSYHRDYRGVSYPLAHSLWIYGGANCPVDKNNVLKVRKKQKSNTKKSCLFDGNFNFFDLSNSFLLKFLNYIRHIPGDN